MNIYILLSITMNKLARKVGWNNEKGGKFLKKLWCFVGGGYYETLLLSTELIMRIDHCTELLKLTFRALALRQSVIKKC